MLRVLHCFMGLVIVACGVSTGWSFSLLGPFKTWQTPELGYDASGSDIGGPMTPTEGYRWNVPKVIYAYDQSFSTYFGPEGIRAVEEAIAILNDLPKASDIADDGVRLYIRGKPVPFDTKRVNYQAQALGLLDVKSVALSLLLEEFGLAEPERWIFALRARQTETIGNVTYTNYSVIKLNYDPITLQPSSYVNNVLYTYRILDPLQPNDYADAFEYPVDPLAFAYSSVAGARSSDGLSRGSSLNSLLLSRPTLSPGEFFTGLTHDDVGAIRFLIHPNNFAVDNPADGVSLIVTSNNVPTTTTNPPSAWVPFTTITNITLISITNTSGGSSPWSPIPINTNFFFVTNIVTTTNLPGSTNLPGGTNIVATNLTNFVTTALRPGMDKITFKRGSFDSLIGQLFITVTNEWTDRYVSNGLPLTQPLRRVVSSPDILFTSEDLDLSDDLVPVLVGRGTTASWVNNDALNGVAGHGGPGVISAATNGSIRIVFTDQLPFLINQSPFLDEFSRIYETGVWASFDGTTNPPVLFPQYLSLTLDDLRRLSLSR